MIESKCGDQRGFLLLLELFLRNMAASPSSLTENGGSLLEGKDDCFGFLIDPLCLPADTHLFVSSLRKSIAHWTSESKKGIWLKLPQKNANLVPFAIEEGFDYHHAEKDFVMLTFWIPKSPSTLPDNASHQVGVGAVIINDKNEILVVQEVTGPTQGSDVWKMPTGSVKQGENILDAVMREVEEETGVKAEFLEVLGVRQSHDVAFGKSDLFFCCRLRLVSSKIKVQESEIAAAKWMPLDEFKSQRFNSESDFLTRIAHITSATTENQYQGFRGEVLPFGFRKEESYFYHNVDDITKYLNQPNLGAAKG